MIAPVLPEDSTLRRHAETEARFARLRELGQPPTDATLKRHYAQLQEMNRTPPKAAPSGAAAATPRPAPAQAAPSTVASASGAEAQQGGLFGWLKRLVGL